MDRPKKNEANQRRLPKRRAARTDIFKYQLSDPKKVELNDLKRALQQSLEEQSISNSGSSTSQGSTRGNNIRRTRSGQIYFVNNAKDCNQQAPDARQTKSPQQTTPPSKRSKLTNGVEQSSNSTNDIYTDYSICDKSRAIKTYSKTRQSNGPRSSTPINKSSDTSTTRAKTTPTEKSNLLLTLSGSKPEPPVEPSSKKEPPKQLLLLTQGTQTSPPSATERSSKKERQAVLEKPANHSKFQSSPKQSHKRPPSTLHANEKYLKPRRESKSDAYAKISAMNVYLSHPHVCTTVTNFADAFKKSSPNSGLGLSHDSQTSSKVSPRNSSLKNPSTGSTKLQNSKSDHQSFAKKTSGSQTSSSKSSSNNSSLVLKLPTTVVTAEHGNNGLVFDGTKSTDRQQPSPKSLSPLKSATTSDKRQSPSLVSQLLHRQTQSSLDLNVVDRLTVQSSWSLLGVPEEKLVYLRNDEPPRRLICYPAIKHIEGDVIQVKDSVLLRSGAKKTDLPYIAKICAFWQDASSGGVMMSLFWYYRPEHTEEGRKPHQLIDEIFASRHRDVDSVDCIEDKCYVLTFNEYCRYRKRCKMDQVKTSWSLADVTIPVSNEAYPRRNRIPDSDVNPELVFCCRQIYDSRLKRLIKNPLINPKYGHI